MKGMHKIRRGSGFRGCLNYCMEGGRGVVIGGNMTGTTPRELSSEFSAARQLRPDVQKPVWHNSLRLPAGERLANEKLAEIGDAYMSMMGFSSDHPRAFILHDDPEGQHIHLVASRISLSGSLYLGKNENLISTKHIAQLEKTFGLTITKQPDYRESGNPEAPSVKKPTSGEINGALKTGIKPPRLVIQQALDKALAEPSDVQQLIELLKKQGITTIAAKSESGKLNGFSFECAGIRFKGSTLGKEYGLAGLYKKGLQNEQINRLAVAAIPAGTARPHQIPRPGITSDSKDDAANQGAASGIGSTKDSSRQEDQPSFLSSSTSRRGQIMKFPATLGGRLYNQKSPAHSDAYDIYYTADKRPAVAAMRWHSDTQRLDLLRQPPTDQDLRTLFELAKNQGLTPPLELHGTQEFQRAAMQFAVKNNITVTPQSKAVGFEHVQILAAGRHEADEAARAARIEADRKAVTDRAEYDRDQAARAKTIYQQQQQQDQRGNKKSTALKLD